MHKIRHFAELLTGGSQGRRRRCRVDFGMRREEGERVALSLRFFDVSKYFDKCADGPKCELRHGFS